MSPLDPQVEALRARRAQDATPPLYTLSIEQARAADLAEIRAAAGTGEPVGAVANREIPGPGGPLPIRIYRPYLPPSTTRQVTARPALVYFFGGGWTLGSLDTGDAICRSLTNATQCVTVAVQYRLAPEHPFPAAVLDCQAGLNWVAEHAAELNVDADRLAVGGDSAGGNLAAAVTLLAREHGGPKLCHQLLVYPNTDYRSDTESLREGTDPLLFNRWSVEWYWKHYLSSEEDGLNPLASPLRAEDLTDLPPATVITAEYDPLRDEGEKYADRLRESGVPVEARRFDGMVHGFFAMSGALDRSREAIDYAAARLTASFTA
jgi:acetyl esterase